LETESTIMSPEGDVLSRTSISAPYDIRYTSFLRGAVASTGWYTPGYGILTTIPGAIFASTYDQKATSEFLRQAEPSYKRFVSQRLMEQIRMVRDDRVDSIGRIQTADPVALAMGDSEVDLGYGPRHYAITVARMDGSLAMPMREDVVQLSPEDAALMKRLWEGKESIGIANIRQLMDALSLSDIPVPEDDQQIAAYTMKGETYVALTPEKTGSSGALAALVPDAR
ncbi:MAG: hypothetical protein HN341_04700, partial [Verrucomicrobia bacterium]|nr:hypothetical protein [Verrucomicrobiota bacterium]